MDVRAEPVGHSGMDELSGSGVRQTEGSGGVPANASERARRLVRTAASVRNGGQESGNSHETLESVGDTETLIMAAGVRDVARGAGLQSLAAGPVGGHRGASHLGSQPT